MIGKETAKAIDCLQKGELVAIPTETVYGLAGNALEDEVVSRIFEIKNRPAFDPLIVHTHSLAEMEKYVLDIPEPARQLAARFMPGPLTLLLEKNAQIPDLVTAGSAWVAMRIPAHPLALQVLQALPFPLAAPSANPFGYISPTSAQHVAAQLGEKIPYILDGGPCQVGVESTIVSFAESKVKVLRKGGLSMEDIEAVIGKVAVQAQSSSNPQAPGMLKSHYAPKIPFFLGNLELLHRHFKGKRIGVLAFQHTLEAVPTAQQFVLTPTGDLTEAARVLFAAMRHLDALALDVIIAEPVPEEGLGRAINDRLRRAAAG
ncbi:MAG TPA: L-threonylcarbamoyladenylate synthase [Saprospiraceae bacterium]|nr:L-threonylcarbamoyladenylate synthase [Saprospiraceae bacterium]HMQ82444.1 L-threonylcarbamoyladenylate synthase [Saprospiraceae bacterium]